MRVERGVVRVEDAHGVAPTIPFWLGEAPGRSDELSRRGLAAARRRSRRACAATRDRRDALALAAWTTSASPSAAASKWSSISRAAHARARRACRRSDTIVLERFFDEVGGMQLVIHSPFGSRINRAWGLALRKRFCRKFNFELQAAATEDNIILSLTTAHSFELAEVARYLHSATVAPVLIQALLDAPMFVDALALGRRRRAGAAALPRRPEGRRRSSRAWAPRT